MIDEQHYSFKNGKRGSEVFSFISHFAMRKAMKQYTDTKALSSFS